MAEQEFTRPSNHVKDISGQRFGKLTVSHCVGVSKNRPHWHCTCDCGNTTIVSTSNLKGGSTKSCGCWVRERLLLIFTKHGLSRTREYKSWLHAKERCFDVHNKAYLHYGGRGITMCKEWTDSCEQFFADMGPRPPGHTLDRIDNDGNYEPGNCRWTTKTIQARNKRTSRKFTHDGETLSLKEWAERTGLPYGTLKTRAGGGSSVPLLAPVDKHRRS